MLYAVVLVSAMVVMHGGESRIERRLVADAKERIKHDFNPSMLKHVVRKKVAGYEVEFFPKNDKAVGNGVICYYSLIGVFEKMECTQ